MMALPQRYDVIGQQYASGSIDFLLYREMNKTI
jgi:hypothetical protein